MLVATAEEAHQTDFSLKQRSAILEKKTLLRMINLMQDVTSRMLVKVDKALCKEHLFDAEGIGYSSVCFVKTENSHFSFLPFSQVVSQRGMPKKGLQDTDRNIV